MPRPLGPWRPLAAAVLLLGVTAAAPRGAANDPKVEAAADAYLRPLVDLDLFQGVVLIARGDRVLLEKGYGFANLELGVRNTPRQVFRVASLSKPFTEVALGRLVEAQRLDLTAPLSRYLPDFPQGDRITIEMLRTHRAGIASMNSIPYDEEAREANTLDSLVRRLAREPLAFEPGSRRRYSNGGYAVLGNVIERITGQSYGDYLEQSVLRPLGLAHTRHEADQALVRDRAYGYVPRADARGEMIVAPFQEMATKTGGGSLVSTAADLRRFLRAMYRDNAIRADTWRTLFPPDSTWAFQGRCPGFNVVMQRDFTHDVEVVVLANNYAAGMVGTIADDFTALARGVAIEKPRWRADVPADSARCLAFTGTFRPPAGALPYGDDAVTVRWHRGGLVLFRGARPLDVMIPQGSDAFLLRTLWSEARFLPGAGAEAPRMTLRPLWLTRDPVALERIAVAADRP